MPVGRVHLILITINTIPSANMSLGATIENRKHAYTRIGMKPRRSMLATLARRDPLSLAPTMYTDLRMLIYSYLDRADIYAILMAGGMRPSWHMLACCYVLRDWICDRVYFGKATLRRCEREWSRHGWVQTYVEDAIAWGYVQYAQSKPQGNERYTFARAAVWNNQATGDTYHVMLAKLQYDRDDLIVHDYNYHDSMVFVLGAIKCARKLGMLTSENLSLALSYGSADMIKECLGETAPTCAEVMSEVATNKLEVIQWAYEYFGCTQEHIDVCGWICSKKWTLVQWAMDKGAKFGYAEMQAVLYTGDIKWVRAIATRCSEDVVKSLVCSYRESIDRMAYVSPIAIKKWLERQM